MAFFYRCLTCEKLTTIREVYLNVFGDKFEIDDLDDDNINDMVEKEERTNCTCDSTEFYSGDDEPDYSDCECEPRDYEREDVGIFAYN
jgi:hypothetical protein